MRLFEEPPLLYSGGAMNGNPHRSEPSKAGGGRTAIVFIGSAIGVGFLAGWLFFPVLVK